MTTRWLAAALVVAPIPTAAYALGTPFTLAALAAAIIARLVKISFDSAD